MNCLCCGKKMVQENALGWHKSCIKQFFGTSSLPALNLEENHLVRLATDGTHKGYTVPGVQKKISLHLEPDKDHPRLTLIDYPTGYILKPQVEDFVAMPEAEHLVMCMADATGIDTVPHALILADGKKAYLTKRIDRITDENGLRKLAMEDFCQLSLRLTLDKYKGSYERCAKIVERYSSRKMLDMSELFLRLVFCFVTGNSDMHLKNFSLIESKPASGQYMLSAAYDLLPVNLLMPEDKEEFALTLNGKKTNLRSKDFRLFADACGLNPKSCDKIIAHVVSMKETYFALCDASFLPDDMKTAFKILLETRLSVFEQPKTAE